jgi:hypothetical protein
LSHWKHPDFFRRDSSAPQAAHGDKEQGDHRHDERQLNTSAKKKAKFTDT